MELKFQRMSSEQRIKDKQIYNQIFIFLQNSLRNLKETYLQLNDYCVIIKCSIMSYSETI